MSSRDLGYFQVDCGGGNNISCPLVAYTFQSYDAIGPLGHSEYRCTCNDSHIWGWQKLLLKFQKFVQEEIIKWEYSSIYLALISVVMAWVFGNGLRSDPKQTSPPWRLWQSIYPSCIKTVSASASIDC